MDNETDLPEVEARGRNRFTGALDRFRTGADVLSPGTIAPRLQALFQPGLYRERLDTNHLMESAFGEGGELAGLKDSNPEQYEAIRDAAANPMNQREHGKFRSAILDMVDVEVQRKQGIDSQIANNHGFMRVFSMMKQALPGANDPDTLTYEEGEFQQIQADYERANTLAMAGDLAGSKEVMVDVRKRADALSANNRQAMELMRKRATNEDIALYSASDNASQALRDAAQDLRKALDSGKPVPEFVLNKALTAYGAASGLQQTNLGDVAASTASGALQGGGAGGITGPMGALLGAGIGATAGGIGELRKYFKSKEQIQALADYLDSSQAQVAGNYQSNRAKLAQRYAPLGIKFGQQQGEVYATLSDAYQAEADKIDEAPPRTPEQVTADRGASLRTTLESKKASAEKAVAAARPDAAANLPNAQKRLEDAMARQQQAEDDLRLFDADMAAQSGERPTGDAVANVRDARQRRENRAKEAIARERQKGIQDALRSQMR